MLVVISKFVVEDSDVVLATIAALKVRILVGFSVSNKFHQFTVSVRNEFVCSNRLMFVTFL